MPSEPKHNEDRNAPTLLAILYTVKGYASRLFSRPKSEEERESSNLLFLLYTAMRYANRTCVLGASNRIEDFEKTSGWIYPQTDIGHGFFRYRKYTGGELRDGEGALNVSSIDLETKKLRWKATKGGWILSPAGSRSVSVAEPISRLNPLEDKQFHLSTPLKKMLLSNMLFVKSRMANCHGRSDLVAEYLWRHARGIKTIEKIKMKSFDHFFIVVNRNSELLKPETWTEGYVIDPWYTDTGLIYPASTFQTQIEEIKAYCIKQYEALHAYGYNTKAYDPLKTEIEGLEYVIVPEKDKYPSYAPYKMTMDYYAVENFGFEDPSEEKIARSPHKRAYRNTLDALKRLEAPESRTAFFKEIEEKRRSAKIEAAMEGWTFC